MGRRTTRGAAVAAAGLPGAASARARAPAGRAARARRPMNPSLRSLLTEPHPYPGRLITVEGIDGSGKSTQLLLLERWLVARRYRVHFADRLTYQILPPLKAGMIVLADRYVYTALGRDVARGVHPEWVRAVYSFAPRPDLALYFRVPIEVSLERLLAGRAKLKYHEAGMDVGLSPDPVESFRLFQSRVLAIYDELTAEFGLPVIDATAEISVQQKLVRRMVAEVLRGYAGPRYDGPVAARHNGREGNGGRR